MTTRPDVGCSKPAIIRSVVVFPHPLGPSSVRNSPSATSSEIASTATVSPKRRVSESSSSMALRLGRANEFAATTARSPPSRTPSMGASRGRERSSHALAAHVLVPVAHPLGGLLLEEVPVQRFGAEGGLDPAQARRERVVGDVGARGEAEELAGGGDHSGTAR